MKYFKIQYGYNEADYLPITENELMKAIALFIEGNGRGIFEAGAIRGQDIMRIVPDWHRDQGWNQGWKMTPEDFEAISHLQRPYQELYSQAKMLTEMALRENKPELLKQPLQEVLKLIPVKLEISDEASKLLADKFNVNGTAN